MAFFPQRFPGHTVDQPTGKAGYFTGISYPTWLAWQVGSVAGILLASQVPPAWGIGFAGTLALLAVMIPLVVNTAALGGVIVAGAVAVAAHGLPYKLGLLLAVLAGMAAASVIDMASGAAEAQA
jgi:predicted branched-subunit amino acid permease